MGYNMNKIDPFALSGIKGIFLNRQGYSFHPITYKKQAYIVDFEIRLDAFPGATASLDDAELLAHIYPYQEKFNLFTGHKGKKLYTTEINRIILSDEKVHDLRRTSKDTLKIHLPEIMQNIFNRWERAMQTQEETKAAVKAAEAWDGVVQ